MIKFIRIFAKQWPAMAMSGLLLGFSASVLAHDSSTRHAGHNTHRYYDKAPRIIYRPISSHKHSHSRHRHEHHWRHIPKHYRHGSHRHRVIRKNRHGHYHYHSGNRDALLIGLGLSLIIND